ncbi:MAG: hypothetical protein FGM54_10820 [Chitinophagaceae bacterium]|nr:hypothetical protein [Chitinophagaceae bacterium]
MAFPMLDYELGDAKLKRLDFSCVADFNRYLQTTRSQFYVKDAWLSLAYAAYLQNNMPEVRRCFDRIKKEGSREADADQEALRIAEAGILPDKDLLRARLLNDGGYNDEALRILKGRALSSFKPGNEQIEYIYRLARIHDELSDTTEAIEFYKLTLQQSGKTKAYYPARAALQLGYIFEAQKRNDTALMYFNRVLALKGHDYKNSLDQKAKAAINRIKK